MSNKSGVSEQIISTPRGGGALQGIGEKFAPDLFTGTGNFTVPIALPPGRNGFQPELNLVYSTGNGNGPFGMGWSLSVPGISRKTAKGVPRYLDVDNDLSKRDTFILSGAEDLVIVAEGPGWTRYRPRTEGLFARIIHHHGPGKNYWQVASKDGLVSFYGTPRPENAPADWEDPCLITDPQRKENIFAWKLSETRDPFGNRILYEYARDQGADQQWDQLYLKSIRYADYVDDGGAEQFLVAVNFRYETLPDHYTDDIPDTQRVYPFSDHRAGFEIRTRKRCTQIAVSTHADTERLVRTYDLAYLDQRDDLVDLSERLPRNGVSLLSQIQVTGHDAEQTEILPPLEFAHTTFQPQVRDSFPLEGKGLPTKSLSSRDVELADLFGNGLPDILEMNGSVRYWRNLGDGRFDRPRPMREAPAGLNLADPGVQMIDANGDGHIDLLATLNGLSGYYSLGANGLWDRRSFQRYANAPSFNLEDPEVKLVDLTGDGVTDVIRSGRRLECFFNDPKVGWQETRWVERRTLEKFPNVNFSDPRVKWGDMCGDGLQDIVLVHDGSITYWPNVGYGNWAPRVHMQNSPRFPRGYNPQRILVSDIDGDGLADVVYVDNRRITLWLNQSGCGWSDPVMIRGTPPVSDIDAVRLVDVLGGGVGGVLWTQDASAHGKENYFFLDFTGGVKPYVMNAMDNHMGAVTRVAYVPSTQFYLADEERVGSRWPTSLPFPVQVVAKVEVIDQISKGKLTTEYRYHHGYWDGGEREFRGFGRVDQVDTESFADYNNVGLHGANVAFQQVQDVHHFSPPTLTKSWFHLGAVGLEHGDWCEIDYRHEYWRNDPPQLAHPVEVQQLLNSSDIPRRIKRDAIRSLRGRALRTELYALDGDAAAERPYTVTESLHSATQVDESMVPTPIFFPHTVGQRTTQWERGDDPMSQFTFTEAYDAYGQSQRQIQIACPRGWRTLTDTPPQPYLATCTETVYAQRDDADSFIVDRVAKTTSYELENSGNVRLLDLKANAHQTIVAQTVNFYDGVAFTGAPFGTLGDYGALVRSETLVLTPEIIVQGYPDGDSLPDIAQSPPYLQQADQSNWSAEYPSPFVDLLPSKDAQDPTRPGLKITPLGYGRSESAMGPYEEGFYVAGERRRYDFQESTSGRVRGLVQATLDPLGYKTAITYDAPFSLLPASVQDAADMVTQAAYDYRVLQPQQVIDPNSNVTDYAFTPLGLLQGIFVRGKVEHEGDRKRAGTQMQYGFGDYAEHPHPIWVRTRRYLQHDTDMDIPVGERAQFIDTVEYSDGFGRLLQTRTQAEAVLFGNIAFGTDVLSREQGNHALDQEPVIGVVNRDSANPNVVVSGWQIYDNKGRVVEKYEPFFDQGWAYNPPEDAQLGQKAILFYDPRGKMVRTVNPAGAEQRVIYGIPKRMDRPEEYIPTPWEAYTYSPNDNAGRTHGAAATDFEHHWDTPNTIEIDALGRTVCSTERNRQYLKDGTWGEIKPYQTRSTYDIRGNLLTVTDAMGRKAFRYIYDLADNQLRTTSIDAGVRRLVLDTAGNEVERRDSKGALILQNYDRLNRPIRLWARDEVGAAVTLREHLVYGDSSQAALTAPADQNLLGKLYQHYDEAGLLTFGAYDFKGNLLEKVRQVIRDEQILRVFPERTDLSPDWQIQPYRVNWQPPDGMGLDEHVQELLNPTKYATSTTYDALNRIKKVTYPQDVDGQRKQLRPRYNRAGVLEAVDLDEQTYVRQIAYDAKGQRTLIVYGNNIMTRYGYDEQTFRLARLFTQRGMGDADNPYTFHPKPLGSTTQRNANILQDYAYEYDLDGNILTIRDRTPESGLPAHPDWLDRLFAYDPLNRLVSATGRECDTPPPASPWQETPRCQDVTKTRAYTQRYQYDPAGNMLELQHTANGNVLFKRAFALTSGNQNNQLATVTVNGTIYAYTYDANGNMTSEQTARHFEWDHSDHLKAFRNQTNTAEPSIHAHYLYDSGGQRVLKLVRRQGGDYDVRVYIDGVFEHYRWDQGNADAEERQNNCLHVMDEQQRIAIVRVGEAYPEDKGPKVQYHLGDHLGSSNVVLGGRDGNENGVINREEYHPYGETSFSYFGKNRYRYSGKELDEENRIYYYGARCYASWLARWLTCDPIINIDYDNLYAMVNANPTNCFDRQGYKTEKNPENMQQEIPLDQVHSFLGDTIESGEGKALWNNLKVMGTKIHVGDEEKLRSESAAARYSSEKNIIFVSSSWIQDGKLKGGKWDPRVEDSPRIILLHEMAHAQQAKDIGIWTPESTPQQRTKRLADLYYGLRKKPDKESSYKLGTDSHGRYMVGYYNLNMEIEAQKKALKAYYKHFVNPKEGFTEEFITDVITKEILDWLEAETTRAYKGDKTGRYDAYILRGAKNFMWAKKYLEK